MKYLLPNIVCALAFACTGMNASAQDLKIAVIDMQLALKDYYKTTIEVKKIEEMGQEKAKSIDELQAVFQQMSSKMAELDKTTRDTLLDESVRKKAFEELQALDKERAAKYTELQDAQRKASAEVMQAQAEMETKLLSDINEALQAIVEAQGLDLVFDKSFLPKAQKAIVHTSDNVKDLTEEVLSVLNAGASN